MQNQQLVDYIKQQMQGGVQKDAVKKALLEAGWPPADVDDSLKAAEPAASPAASPAAAATAQTFNPASAMGGGAAPVRSVQAASPAANSTAAFASPKTAGVAAFAPAAEEEKPQHSWNRIVISVMGAVIVILLGAIIYIYFNLNGRVAAVSGESASGEVQFQDLNQQITQLTANNTDLSNQLAAAKQETQTFSDEALFFSPDKEPSAEVTLSGTVASGTGAYTLTTAHHIMITVKNSKDPKVVSALKPLVGQTASLTGTRKVGTSELTLTAVNGTSLTAPAAATPPPASTTAPAAATAPSAPPAGPAGPAAPAATTTAPPSPPAPAGTTTVP